MDKGPQERSAVHIGDSGNSLIIPCQCSDTDDRLEFHYEADEATREGSEFSFITLTIGCGYSLRHRLRMMWEVLRRHNIWGSMMMNYETAKELRDWLDQKIKETEAKPSER